MDSASVGFSLILRASSFSNSYDAVLAVIYLGILSIVFFPPLRGGLGWGCFPPLRGEELRSIERPVDGRRTLPGGVVSPPLRGGLGWGYFSSYSQFSATAARISLYFFRTCRTPLFYDFKWR